MSHVMNELPPQGTSGAKKGAPDNPVPDSQQVVHQSATQNVNWQDFRDHLATADQQGNRRWIYPKRPEGRFYQARTYLSWLLLAVMFIGPFVKINGNPLLLFNIVDRKFSILGQIFWPQDTVIFAIAMLVFFTGIIVFTAAFGRLWCGWTCPQTLLMEMVFRKIEYLIEGDASSQKALDAAPWSAAKATKKLLKHSVFFGLSFVIGNTLLSYIIGTDSLFQIITDNPLNHVRGLTFMILFTLLFYAIFARFREQACTFICPYGRFQSALLDENTIVVAYDHKRGEGRGRLQKTQSTDQRRAAGLGDCIDCKQCVAVCPTGIDIRNGTQMECVNCTACIDACDRIMDNVHQPRGLIRYASLNGIEKGQRLQFTLRLKGYAALLIALITVFAILVFTRSDVETTLLRAPGALFQKSAHGDLSNLYTLQIANKTSHPIPVQLRLIDIPGKVTIIGGDLVVQPGKLSETSVLIEIPTQALHSASTQIRLAVDSPTKNIETISTSFIGPRDGSLSP